MTLESEPVKNASCGCEHGHDESSLPRGFLVSAAGILLGAGLAVGWMAIGPDWLKTTAFALATLSGGLLVFPSGWKALLARRLDMNVLMTVAVAGAWLIGEHAEAAAVVFLFALSELLESWAATRARRAVDTLLELSPATAIVMDPDGSEREKPVTEIAIGTNIRVRSGSRIPLDGAFIAQRLRELDDRRLHSTEQLLRRYGERHVAQLRAWFTRAGEELDGR